MKPARFEYADPESENEVLAVLAERGDEAKILAGGQSLVPLLNMRLAVPEVLVDINRVAQFNRITNEPSVAFGALVRQAQLERNARLQEEQPLLMEAIRYVGHPQIRNRGTIVGSLAHADPAAELPLVFQTLNGWVDVAGARGARRRVDAQDFFVHIMTTSLEPTEMAVAAGLPRMPRGTGTAFVEVARRHGDFALVGAAVSLRLQHGFCEDIRIGMSGVAPVPVRAQNAESFLKGVHPSEAALNEAAVRASSEISPVSDIHGTAEYRREVARALVKRALVLAKDRSSAQEQPADG